MSGLQHEPTVQDAGPGPPAGFGGGLTVVMAGLGLVALGLVVCQLVLLWRQQQSLREQTREHQFWILCRPSASVEERTRAFLRLAADGHSEWRSAATQGLELRGSRLPQAQLSLADLSACDLREAGLIESDLTGARLRTADLTGADLTEATLDGADCLKATLDEAEFQKARLRSTLLEQVSAVNARFVLADMSEVQLLMADLSGADLTGANLTGATLEATNLRGATLALTNLAGADLTGADLTDSNWWRARGLGNDQLIDFAARFAPSDQADPSRINDFLLWTDRFQAPSADDSGLQPSGE